MTFRGLLLGLILMAVPTSPLRGGQEMLAHGSVVKLDLREPLLSDLGVTIEADDLTLIAAPGAVLTLRTRHHQFQGFGSSAVPLAGNLRLVWANGDADLSVALLRSEDSSLILTLIDSDGTPIFEIDHLHAVQDIPAGRLRLFNGDVRLTQAFAERLGKEEHAGLAIGVLELTAFMPRLVAGESLPPCPDPAWDLDVDVALSNIDSVGPGFREAGVRVVVLPSASLENVGQAAIPWYRRFSGSFAPYDNDQHPYLVWNLYRFSSGRMEQIGRSAVKHAFHTINVGCAARFTGCSHPQYNNVFWPTCNDVYGESTNSRLRDLGPRTELDPLTGEWEPCGSLADQDCDGQQDDVSTSDPFAQQMAVQEEDLRTPGARYFIEAWYLARGDVDIFNSMGHREIDPDDSSGVWAFPFQSSFRHGPAVDAWVAPEEESPAVDTNLYSGEKGHFRLAVRTRDLGGGRFRYDYVVMNLDLGIGIDEFRVPLAPKARLFKADFTDADDEPSNDWNVERGARSLLWKAAEGRSLPWGTLFRFGVETDIAPKASTGRLRLADGSERVSMEILAPAPPLDVLFQE